MQKAVSLSRSLVFKPNLSQCEITSPLAACWQNRACMQAAVHSKGTCRVLQRYQLSKYALSDRRLWDVPLCSALSG